MLAKKNIKNGKEKSVALFEIILLTVSIITFSYYIGEEFRFVSAIKPTNPVDTFVKNGLASSLRKDAEMKFFPAIGAHIGSIITAAAFGYGLYTTSKMIGGWIFGADSPVATQLATYLTGGFAIGETIGLITSIIGKLTPGGLGPGWTFLASSNPLGITGGVGDLISKFMFAGSGGAFIGILIGLIVFFLLATNERIDAVTFNCLPWQPISGGRDCEKCNSGVLPCSEYKCQSLGAGCELLNVGTDEETCAYNNRNDITSPSISSWRYPLKENYSYIPASATLPAASSGTSGVKINYTMSADGCIPPFTLIPFGITLNKPGKCRIDSQRKNNFSAMSYLVSNGYSIYNHTLYAFSPGLAEAEREGLPITNARNQEIYVRCEGVNGVSNVGTFVFKFCVQSQPDITATRIVSTNPLNNMPVNAGREIQETTFYTDKPADCKWSHRDEEYSFMTNNMSCDRSITDIGTNMLYKCKTNITGIRNSIENKFYVRCKSYPLNENRDRVENSESYIYTLIGTQPLVINSVEPLNGTLIKGSTSSIKVVLKAKTSAGYDHGKAWCSYNETSGTGTNGRYILFRNTESYESTQELWLGEGSYGYSMKCCDLGGNCDTNRTNFKVEIDTIAPIVTRVYNEGSELKIMTNEESTCVYDTVDCSYEFEEGIAMTSTNHLVHYVGLGTTSNFFIKCKDNYDIQPNPNECTIIARPFTSY